MMKANIKNTHVVPHSCIAIVVLFKATSIHHTVELSRRYHINHHYYVFIQEYCVTHI